MMLQKKEPSIMAKGMVWMKTNMQEIMHKSDSAIADLITDGCNMGVKSLTKYILMIIKWQRIR